MPKLQKYLDAINKNKKAAAGTAIGAGVLATPEDAEAGVVDATSKFAKRAADVEFNNTAKNLGFSPEEYQARIDRNNEIKEMFNKLPSPKWGNLFHEDMQKVREGKVYTISQSSEQARNILSNANDMLNELNIEAAKKKPNLAKIEYIKKRLQVEKEYYVGLGERKPYYSLDNPYVNNGYFGNWKADLKHKLKNPTNEKGSATPKAIGTLGGLSLAGSALAKGLSTIPQDMANYANDIAYNSPAGLLVEGANAYGKLGAGYLGKENEYQQNVGQYVDRFAESKTEPFKKLDEAVGGAITKGFMTVENAVDYLKNNKGVNQMLGSVNPTPYQ